LGDCGGFRGCYAVTFFFGVLGIRRLPVILVGVFSIHRLRWNDFEVSQGYIGERRARAVRLGRGRIALWDPELRWLRESSGLRRPKRRPWGRAERRKGIWSVKI